MEEEEKKCLQKYQEEGTKGLSYSLILSLSFVSLCRFFYFIFPCTHIGVYKLWPSSTHYYVIFPC